MTFIERKHMKGFDNIIAIQEYLDYLSEHLENVRLAFNNLSEICDGMWWVCDDLSWHTLREEVCCHDLSKFSQEEFIQCQNTFFPVDKRVITKDFDLAWEHHKKRNHHHWETAETALDIVHMIIDWTAMGYNSGDTAYKYYEEHKNEIKLSGNHKEILIEILERIKEYDDDKV